jgi:CHRD domain
MKGRVKLAVGVAALAAVAAAGTVAVAGGGDSIREELTGYEEDPLVLSTTGNGSFRARIDERQQEISYRLSYADLEGSILQAHIHLGGAAQSGGISVFLCSNLGNGPAGTPLCPPAPDSVSGTLTPASVIGPAGQGIAAGEFAELVDAIRAGVTYANVHTSKYPGGEIRAQLDGGKGDRDGDNDD